MQVTVATTYRIDVTQRELNLIGLSLAGMLKPEDKADAAALNVTLLQQRAVAQESALELTKKAIKSLPPTLPPASNRPDDIELFRGPIHG